MYRIIALALGVVACILSGACAFENGTVDTQDLVVNSTSGPNGTALCPAGWSLYSGEHTSVCIYLSQDELAFDDALDACADLGGDLATAIKGKDDMHFIIDAILAVGGEYWIALKKDQGYSAEYRWVTLGNQSPDTLGEVPKSVKEFPSYNEQCVYASTYSDDLEFEDCSVEYRYVCQKKIECPPGTFGPRCERECHCLGGTCDVTEGKVTCPFGCQRGWLGEACDIERSPIDVKYYCAQNDKVSNVYIRVFTNGLENITIYNAATSRYSRGNIQWTACRANGNFKQSAEPGWSTIRIMAMTQNSNYYYNNANDGYTHEICSKYQLDGQMWRVEVKEKPNVVLENDVTVQLACNFSKVANLSLTASYNIQDQSSQPAQKISPESIDGDVTLTLLDAVSNKVVTTADLGTPVKLRLQYGLKAGSTLQSVTPKSCDVQTTPVTSRSYGSRRDRISNRFIDSEGCVVGSSTIHGFNKTSSHTLETPWFPLFQVNNSSSIYITCAYDLCFDNEVCRKPKCGRGPNRRRYRRSADGEGSSRITSQRVTVIQHDKSAPRA